MTTAPDPAPTTADAWGSSAEATGQDTAPVWDTTAPTQASGVDHLTATAAFTPALPAATYRSGPAVGSILIGLLGIATAVWGWLFVVNDYRVDWSVAGPGAVIGLGALFVTLGTWAALSRRRTT